MENQIKSKHVEAWQDTKMAILRCKVLVFHLEELIDIGKDVVMSITISCQHMYIHTPH